MGLTKTKIKIKIKIKIKTSKSLDSRCVVAPKPQHARVRPTHSQDDVAPLPWDEGHCDGNGRLAPLDKVLARR